MESITSQNVVNPRALRVIRVACALVVFCNTIFRCLFSWNHDIPPLFYFTVQSNILCGVYWLIGGLSPRTRTNQLSCLVTTYITLTGIVFIFFLDDGFLETIYTKLLLGEISDVIHYFAMIGSIFAHFLIPFIAILDFLLFSDMRGSRQGKIVFAYPFAYLALTLIYSRISEKYIYPFLDPAFMGGWHVVVILLAIILCLLALIDRGLRAMNRKTQNAIDRYLLGIQSGA